MISLFWVATEAHFKDCEAKLEEDIFRHIETVIFRHLHDGLKIIPQEPCETNA